MSEEQKASAEIERIEASNHEKLILANCNLLQQLANQRYQKDTDAINIQAAMVVNSVAQANGIDPDTFVQQFVYSHEQAAWLQRQPI